MHLLQSALSLVVILGCSSCRKLWHSNFMGISENPRNEFILRNVSIDEKFSLNTTVNYWRSINSRRYSSYAAGISNESMIVLNITKTENPSDFKIIYSSKKVNESFRDAILVQVPYKNRRDGGIFLVCVSWEQKVFWFDVETLELIWTWNLGYNADRIKLGFNNVLDRSQFFLTSLRTIYIYNFEVTEKKLWLTETLQLSAPIGEFDMLPLRNHFYLLLPQKSIGELLIFRYDENHFRSYKNISSDGIEQVVAFQVNYKSFFAVNGLEAGIYQLGLRNQIFMEKITNSHLEGLKYWMPVRVNNLRKNFILFGQRVVEHGSHKSLEAESFIYNGKHFEEHEDIPCQIFGEKFNSLQCLATSQDAVGIDGAAAVSVGNNLGLLLAKRSPHNLFKVHFEVKDIDSSIRGQMKKLNETKIQLQKLLDERLKNITSNPVVSKAVQEKPVQGDGIERSASHNNQKSASVENSERPPIVEARSNLDLNEKLDSLLERLDRLKKKMDEVEAMERAGKFKKIIINGRTVINKASVENVSSESLNDQPLGNIFEDTVRKDKNQTVGGTKTFTDLDVKNLYFDSLNDIKSENIMFHDSDTVAIRGNVLFEKPVAVMKNIKVDTINGMPSSSIPIMEAHIGDTLSFESLNVENIHTQEFDKLPVPEDWSKTGKLDYVDGQGSVVFVPHNVTVKRVNGVNFEELLRQICLVNTPNHIPGTVVINGNVTVDEPSEVDYLNDLEFPEAFISINEQEALTISGRKVFKNTLTTNVVNTNEHYINEFKSEDFFTLSTPQEITDKATFSHLEITRKFLHDGKIIGNQLNNFLPNPTLANTFNITSNVNFEALEVTGSVIVEYMDNLNYGKILQDIIYKDENISRVNSIKEFTEGLTIRNNLEITSNSINLIPLDQIVTKDTPQFLNLPQLNGDVSIETMEAKQLIGGINVTKLDQEAVKTFGEQFISSILIFEDLEAENLEVKESLNEILVGNFYTTNGDRIMDHKTRFDEVQVENLSVSKNVEGFFVEMNLRNFTKNRLSYSKSQNIEENVTLENARTEKINCQADTALCQVVLDDKKTEDAMMNKVSSGNIRVKELFVKEELNVEQMNGIPLKEIQELEQKSAVIDGNVFFSNIQVAKLSGVPLNELLDDAVHKNETAVEIKGLKVFQKGFVVQKLIETDKLNDVPVENLFTKQGNQVIEAPLQIFGNVTFKNNVNISETINDVSVQEVKEYFDYHDDIFIIKDDITFDRLTYIKDLNVLGNINGKDSYNVINNIAYLNGELNFWDEMEFTRRVDVAGNMEIAEHLNSISISDINDNIVYLNKIKDNNIDSPVIFTGENVFAHNLLIETNLITKWMRGLNLESFKENAIFLNKGFLNGTYHFKNITINEKLITTVINKIDMSKTIPLGSEQNIDQFLIKNVVFLNNVTVKDSVNGFDLKKEYANSVLNNKDQTIISEIYFKNNTLIKHNLEVGGLLNGYPIDKIVTTDTNQTLTATYNFIKTVMESNLHATGFVNSINMSEWETGAIKISSKDPQGILAPWYFKKNLTFEDTLDGEKGIYDFDIAEEMQQIRNEKDHRRYMELRYEEDYKSICKDIHSLNIKSKKQTNKFENLEEMQLLEYHHEIRRAHFFNFDKQSIILNGVGSCQIDVFHLEDETFVRDSEFAMGEIDQIVSVRSDDSFFFVVKTVSNIDCDNNGTLVWQYNNGSITKLQNIENQQLIQESLVPLTFYGLNKNGVTEFKIDMSKAIPIQPYRTWKIREENTAFMPRGVGTGLAVRTGKKMIQLLRDEPIITDNEIEIESSAIKGEMKYFDNSVVPGRNNSNMIVINVGPKSLQKTFIAIIFREDTIVERNVDVIKIYEDYSTNTVFQEISTYNPTSFVSLELGNGETLLLILENEEKLQIYRYRGVEGFRLHLTAEIFGSHMFKMVLPVSSNGDPMETVAIVKKNKIKILKPIMIGNPTNENIECP